MDYVPYNDNVEELIHELDGEFNLDEDELRLQISIPMTIRHAPQVRRLAKAIRSVVGRGRFYSNSLWIWQAPRAARSLEAFAKVLANAYRHARGLESIE